MATYTVILDYRGGTHISQVSAGNARAALVKWAKQIKPNEIQHLGPKRQAKLASDIESNYADLYSPTPLQGVPIGKRNVLPSGDGWWDPLLQRQTP